MNKPHGLQYVMCPGASPEPTYVDHYNQIYQCWLDVWRPALAEMGHKDHLYSELFTRQDYIGAIFYQGKCVAMCFYRWADAGRPEFANDSYFSNWAPEHIQKLRSRGDKIIVCCQFTVHPAARKDAIGLPGKDLLMGMVIETFMNAKADGMTGAVRVNRGVNKAGERWGAEVIARNIESDYPGQEVDLIGFFKDHIMAAPPHDLSNLTRELWANRIHIGRLDISREYEMPKPQRLKIAV